MATLARQLLLLCTVLRTETVKSLCHVFTVFTCVLHACNILFHVHISCHQSERSKLQVEVEAVKRVLQFYFFLTDIAVS